MTRATQAVGRYGERLAVRHLTEAGMVVLDRNWRGRAGEIDIVAREGGVLVFCEVKTRRVATHGSPAEAVVAGKTRRLRRLAAEWLAGHLVHPDEVRFDVVAVTARSRGAARVEHVRAAF